MKKSKIQVSDVNNSIGKYPFFTSGKSILKHNDYLVDGSYCYLNTGGLADVKFYDGKASFSTDTWCIFGKDDYTNYLFFNLFSIKDEINKKYFKGTSLKHLQKDILKEEQIFIPSKQQINEFNKIVHPLLKMISKNDRENSSLIELRDFLLPLLLNSQVTIADNN